MQQTIDEDRERARIEERERLEAEKEAERSEAVKEKPKGNMKKERKKDAKPKVESLASSEVDNGMEQESSQPFVPTPVWKLWLHSMYFTSFLMVGVFITMIGSPHMWEGLISILPDSHRAGALEYVRNLRKNFLDIFK